MKKLLILSCILISHPILALDKDEIPDIHEYSCEFENVKIHIEIDENYLNSEYLAGTNIDGKFTRGFGNSVRVGEVTQIFSSGDIDRYNFFALRGNFNMNYMVGFFISNYGKDINILNIQTWEDNTPNSHYAYTDDTTHLSNGVITTEDGKCRPIR